MGKVASFFSAQSITLSQQQKRQMLALDQEVSDMESQIKVLEAQNLKLQAQVNPLEREIQRLQQKLDENSLPPKSVSPIQLEFLQVLNKCPNTTTDEFAEAFNMTGEAAKFHLDLLHKIKFVDSRWDYEGEHWYLMHAGRSYLHEKDLLK